MKTITNIFLIIISVFIGFCGCQKDQTVEIERFDIKIKNISSDNVTFRATFCNNMVGICYSEDYESPTLDNSLYIKFGNNYSDYGIYIISNLKQETAYYWRIFTINDNKIVYGKVQTFTTEAVGVESWYIGYPVAANVIARLTTDSTLTISGSGDMEDYNYGTSAPWYNYRTQIKKLVFENGITHIGDCVFCCGFNSDYKFTGNLTIPNSVTSIGNRAFEDCGGFVELTIPNSVISIGDMSFAGCNDLISINVDNGNTNYSSENGVLFNKNKNTLVCCPAGKTGSYTISNIVTTIGDGAFYYCNKLIGNLIIPNSVTNIGNSAFAWCLGFNGNLTIPNSVENIDNSAFLNCNFIGDLTIPNSVTTIGSGAFANCSGFTGNLTIPNSVTTIGSGAFENCSNLTDIKVSWAEPLNIDYNNCDNCDVFYNINKSNVKLHVPSGTKSLYQAATVWQDFNIVED